MDTTIRRDMPIEDLLRVLPPAVTWLRRRGIRCLACGEPIWGTLEDAAREKGCDDETIDGFVRELEAMRRQREAGTTPPSPAP